MTRMWMLNPECLCGAKENKHLLGESNEIHKANGNMRLQRSIAGYVQPECIMLEPSSMKRRHDELAEEMLKRGYNHRSPFEPADLSYLPKEHREAKVNINQSLEELISRCPYCKKRIEAHLYKKYRNMIYKICNSWSGVLEFDDLVSIAGQVLLDCVDSYKADRGCFSTFLWTSLKNRFYIEQKERIEFLSKTESIDCIPSPHYNSSLESQIIFKISMENLSQDGLFIVNSVLNTPMAMIDLSKEETGKARICKRRIQRHLIENEGWWIGRCWRGFDEIKKALSKSKL